MVYVLKVSIKLFTASGFLQMYACLLCDYNNANQILYSQWN